MFAGGLLTAIDRFEAGYFGLTTSEAETSTHSTE